MSEFGTGGPASPEESDPRSGTTLLVGVVGVALLVVVVLLLEVLFKRTAESEFRRRVVDEPSAELSELQAEQIERLQGYRWVDEQEGVVTIPIERAMELVVEESRGGGER
ncbi:MAG: hypothetical protein ACYTGC_10925 [Planctomycetota bacterium]|jgi:hypothetical protein